MTHQYLNMMQMSFCVTTCSTSDLSKPHSQLPNFSLFSSDLSLFHICSTLSFPHLYIPPVLFSRFFWAENFWTNLIFSLHFQDQKSWHNYTYFQGFLEHFLNQKNLRCLQWYYYKRHVTYSSISNLKIIFDRWVCYASKLPNFQTYLWPSDLIC